MADDLVTLSYDGDVSRESEQFGYEMNRAFIADSEPQSSTLTPEDRSIVYTGDTYEFLSEVEGDAYLVVEFTNNNLAASWAEDVREGERDPGTERIDEMPPNQYDVVPITITVDDTARDDLAYIDAVLADRHIDRTYRYTLQDDVGAVQITSPEYRPDTIEDMLPDIDQTVTISPGIAGLEQMRYQPDGTVQLFEYSDTVIELQDDDLSEDGLRGQGLRSKIAHKLRDDVPADEVTAEATFFDTTYTLQPDDWMLEEVSVDHKLIDDVATALRDRQALTVDQFVLGSEYHPRDVEEDTDLTMLERTLK